MGQSTVLYEVADNVGWVTLNRPRVLNSLNLSMVKSLREQLAKWAKEPDIALVVIDGAGDKGLCAGGDVRDLYERGRLRDTSFHLQFFTTEYMMDRLIYGFQKPILVYMDGVVMGGGVGLSTGCSHRIVTERTKWAMPEMNIGFFPDVGSSYFLTRAPGTIGRYLALTSTVIDAADVLYAGLADYYLESRYWQELVQSIRERTWTANNAVSQLDRLLTDYETPPPPSSLREHRDDIDRHFHYETVEGIVASLEKAERSGDAWAKETRVVLLSKSPTSLKVTLEQLLKGANKTLAECFMMELDIAMNFMEHGDFYEGVRALLIDKDKRPVWEPGSLTDVSAEKVASFFQYAYPGDVHPLETSVQNDQHT